MGDVRASRSGYEIYHLAAKKKRLGVRVFGLYEMGT
jgi:hypothetical protein